MASSHCQAITQHGFYACKNQAREGHDTCSVHKRFFHKGSWIKRFLKADSEAFALLGYADTTETGRVTKHIQQTFISGRVSLDEADARAIPALPKMVDTFLLLAQIPTFNPNWNKRLLKQAVHDYLTRFHDYYLFSLIHPYTIYTERLAPILNNPHMGLKKTLQVLFEIKEKRERALSLQHRQDSLNYTAVLAAIFMDGHDELTWYSPETLQKWLAPAANQEAFFQKELLPYLKRATQAAMKHQKEKMDRIKEELVTMVYHPDNVMRWLNAGGHDLLEMMA